MKDDKEIELRLSGHGHVTANEERVLSSVQRVNILLNEYETELMMRYKVQQS
jgi:hypothetical protein